MTDDPIICKIAGKIAVLTLNNPPLNVMTLEFTRCLSDLLDGLVVNEDVRVVVITGSGSKAFCAGSDIKEFPELREDRNLIERKLRFENDVLTKLDRLSKPTIAALNGLAYGGGLELAACCDLTIAEEHVRLALPEILLGHFPGSGGTIRVTRRVGEGRAKQLMFLGEPISASTGYEWGLVNFVVPEGQALSVANTLAEKLTQRPLRALALCKQSIDESFSLEDEISIARMLTYADEVFGLPDSLEGMKAFFAKRAPIFVGSR